MSDAIGETAVYALFGAAGGVFYAYATGLVAPGLAAIHGALTLSIATIAYRILIKKNLNDSSSPHEHFVSLMPITVLSGVVATGILHMANYLTFSAKVATVLTGSSLIGTAIIASSVGHFIIFPWLGYTTRWA